MPSIASKNSRARILIVEDDPVMAGSLVELFTMDGYQAAVAKNGSTAKAKLQELHPDLVILDLMLPDIDGLVLCSELSRAAVPFIVCSGTNRQRDRILARRLGADDFIAKPFDIYEFEARVAADEFIEPKDWMPSTCMSSRQGWQRSCADRSRPTKPGGLTKRTSRGRRQAG